MKRTTPPEGGAGVVLSIEDRRIDSSAVGVQHQRTNTQMAWAKVYVNDLAQVLTLIADDGHAGVWLRLFHLQCARGKPLPLDIARAALRLSSSRTQKAISALEAVGALVVDGDSVVVPLAENALSNWSRYSNAQSARRRGSRLEDADDV